MGLTYTELSSQYMPVGLHIEAIRKTGEIPSQLEQAIAQFNSACAGNFWAETAVEVAKFAQTFILPADQDKYSSKKNEEIPIDIAIAFNELKQVLSELKK